MDPDVLCAELAELGEGGCGFAGVDGLGTHGHALFQVVGEARGDKGSGGIEQDDVAASAGNAGEDVVEVGGVGGDVSAGELVESRAGQAGHFGRDAGGFEGGLLAGFSLFDAADDGFPGSCEFIDSIGSVNHEGTLRAQRRKSPAEEEYAARSKDADHLIAGTGGVCERSAEVEDGAEAEGAAEGAEDLHGWVVERGVEEHEAGGAEALDGELGRKVDGHSEGFKNIGCAAAGGDGAVAVLGDAGSGGSSDQGRTRGDVEGERAAAAGTDDIDELGAFVVVKRHMGGALAHDLNEAGELGGLFAAGGEDSDKSGDLDLGHIASEDFSEDVGGLFAGHGRAIFGESLEEVFDRGHTPRW